MTLHRELSFFGSIVLVTGLAFFATVTTGEAQEILTVPTNIPGITAFTAPPENFDPLTAPATTLQQYGFPPRPDQNAMPQAYAHWKRAVTAPTTRIVPTLEQTEISHGPIQQLSVLGTKIGNATTANSANWSGYVIYDNTKPFKLEEIETEFVVPVAQQAFKTCLVSSVDASAWVGIDGYNISNTSPDVLQAGVDFDATCVSAATVATYATWIEWFPNNETRVTGFPTSAGDVISIEVWSTGPTTGEAYLVNYTANVSTTLALTAPNGTTLQGNSVEWIVERPTINSAYATLTNYVAMPFTDDQAWNYKAATASQKFYYPSKAPTGKIYVLTMQDNSGNPISYPVLDGTSDLWFYDEGSAN